jgi:hypothetical protein
MGTKMARMLWFLSPSGVSEIQKEDVSLGFVVFVDEGVQCRENTYSKK